MKNLLPTLELDTIQRLLKGGHDRRFVLGQIRHSFPFSTANRIGMLVNKKHIRFMHLCEMCMKRGVVQDVLNGCFDISNAGRRFYY